MIASITENLLPRIRDICSLPAFDDEAKARRAGTLNFLILATLPAVVLTGLLFLILHPDTARIFFITSIVFILEFISLRLLRNGQVDSASRLLIYGLVIIVLFASFISGGVSQVGYSAYVIVIITGGLLLGKQTIFKLAGVGILAGSVILLAENYGFLPPDRPPGPMIAWIGASTSFIWASAVLYIAMQSLERALERARKEIAARKHIQAQVLQLATVVEQASESVTITDLEGNIEYVNPYFEKISGYAASEVLGRNPSILSSGLQDQGFYKQLWHTITQGNSWRGIFINQHKDGGQFYKESTIFPIKDHSGQVINFADVGKDITERIQAEKRLENYAERLEILREIDQSILATQRPNEIASAALRHIRKLISCNRASVSLFDYEADQAVLLATDVAGKSNLGTGTRLPLISFSSLPYLLKDEFHLVDDIQEVPEGSYSREQLLSEGVHAILNIPLKSRGQLIGALNLGAAEAGAFTDGTIEVAREIANSLAVALQNAQLFQESQNQAMELAGLYETALATSSVLETNTLLQHLYVHVEKLLSPDTFVVVLCKEETQDIEVVFVVEQNERLHEFESMRLTIQDSGLTGWVLDNRRSLLVADMLSDPLPVEPKHSGRPARAWLGVPLIARDRLVGAISVQSFRPNAFDKQNCRFLESLAAQVAISLENARLFESERKRTKELAVVAKVSAALRNTQTRTGMLPVILNQVFELLDAQGAAIAIYDSNDELVVECARGSWGHWAALSLNMEEIGLPQNLVSCQPFLNNKVQTNILPDQLKLLGDIKTMACVPLITQKKTIGAVYVGRTVDISNEEISLLSAIADIAASAVQRASLYEQTTRRLHQVQALHAIDQAITSSVDLRLTLKTVLEQIKSQLRVDAATILLLDQHTKVLEFASRIGFQTGALRHTRLNIGESFAGQAALERRIVHLSDLTTTPGDFKRAVLLAQEGFVTYYAVPLIAKGQVKGVLELFQRQLREPDPDWEEFLTSLATQAAIAIDNSQLFRDLQRSNQELALAYDTTLEGWSRALELRDQETEGHTHRVTNLTLRLARAMNMSDPELIHVRRGALLHDIGKMGIPDSILLKNGPLTDEEWTIMRKHPTYAYQLLSPVPFLRLALDIPYYHHEKWDGTGYPQGLKGEQIPLAARIFAVVDVWDALNSDRPYRRAWQRERVLEYIRSQAGKHFDPNIVNVFLQLINDCAENPAGSR